MKAWAAIIPKKLTFTLNTPPEIIRDTPAKCWILVISKSLTNFFKLIAKIRLISAKL